MAQRYPFFAVLMLLSACGGRETGDSPASTGSGGGGSAVVAGTGGSSGTASTTGDGGTSTTTTGAGGSATGGRSGGYNIAECTSMDTCLLEPISTCGAGCEPVPLASFTAINASNLEIYKTLHPPMPCAAGACLAPPPGTATSQNYYAVCEAGQCEAVDVRMTSLSACNVDTDCVLRSGTTCCGCGNGNLIAVSKQSNVEQVFCGPGGACAADCVSAPIPPGISASCAAGHCLVRYPAVDGGIH